MKSLKEINDFQPSLLSQRQSHKLELFVYMGTTMTFLYLAMIRHDYQQLQSYMTLMWQLVNAAAVMRMVNVFIMGLLITRWSIDVPCNSLIPFVSCCCCLLPYLQNEQKAHLFGTLLKIVQIHFLDKSVNTFIFVFNICHLYTGL